MYLFTEVEKKYVMAVIFWLILQNGITLLNGVNHGKYHSLLSLFPHVRVQLS